MRGGVWRSPGAGSIFKLPSANDRDKALFKKYLPELTVLPPGRGFYERINARQST